MKQQLLRLCLILLQLLQCCSSQTGYAKVKILLYIYIYKYIYKYRSIFRVFSAIGKAVGELQHCNSCNIAK